MLLCMRRLASSYLFCTIGKLRAVEAIYQQILKGDTRIHQIQLLGNVDQFLQNQTTPRTLLSDRIRNSLRNLQFSKVSTIEQLRYFREMIDPRVGIDIKNNKAFESQKQRFLQGQRKSVSQNYSFKFNSQIMKSLLSLFYGIDRKTKEIQRNFNELNVIYVVGTPGLGKSSSLMGIKDLNNIRIRAIIRCGHPSDSIVKDNFKIFYFHSLADQQSLKQQFLQETIGDFGEQVRENLLKQQNFISFLQKIKKIYKQKSILLLIIIDQANAMYNLSKKKRQEQMVMWEEIRSAILHPYPLFIISSKNNPYLTQKDPIIHIATASGRQYIRKVILDHLISPESRLCYTAECILFELEKHNVLRNKAIQFLQQMGQLPFLTHLSIQEIFEQIINFNKNVANQINNGNFSQIIEKMTQKKKSIRDQLNLTQNIQRMKQKQKQLSYTELLGLLQMFFLYNPSTNYVVKAAMEIIDENGNSQKVNRQFKTVIRQIKDNQWKQQLQKISTLNYFFKGLVLKNIYTHRNKNNDHKKKNTQKKYNKNIEQKVVNSLIFNLDSNDHEKLKIIHNQILNPKILQEIKHSHPQICQLVKKYGIGKYFENQVCSAIQKNCLQIGYEVRVYIQKTLFCNLKSLQSEFQLNLNQDNFSQFKKNVAKYVNFIQNNQVCYVRSSPGGQAFDFILSNNDSGKISLHFVDVTVKYDVSQKITNFFNLWRNTNFRKLIQAISEKPNVKQIIIKFHVLLPHKGYYQKQINIGSHKIQKQQFVKISNKVVELNYSVIHLIKDFGIQRRTSSYSQNLTFEIAKTVSALKDN